MCTRPIRIFEPYGIKIKNSRYSQLEGREELFERDVVAKASGESFDDYGLNLRGRLHFTYEWLWSGSSVRVTRPDRDLSWPVIPPNLKEEDSQWRR